MRRTERLFALAEYLRGHRTGVTAEALAPFEVAAPVQEPPALPYLDSAWNRSNGALAVRMTAAIVTPRMRADGAAPFILTDTQFAGMYWTAATMVAHHATNGCNLLAGDLLGTNAANYLPWSL